MGAKIFGWEHIVYLALTLIATGVIIFFVARKAKKTSGDGFLRTTTLVTGIVFLCAIAANRISCAVAFKDATALLPKSLCGTVSVFFSLVLIFGKKNNAALQFISTTALLTGAITIFYPDFIGQLNYAGEATGFLYMPTITGIFHHSMQLFAALLVLITGYCRLEIKRWAVAPVGLAFFMVYGRLLSDAFNIANSIDAQLLNGVTFTSWYIIELIYLSLYTAALLIADTLTVPKEQRFLTKLFSFFKRVFHLTPNDGGQRDGGIDRSIPPSL